MHREQSNWSYVHRMVFKRPLRPDDTPAQFRNDKNVVSREASETTKMSFAYNKENEEKENKTNVNDDKPKK